LERKYSVQKNSGKQKKIENCGEENKRCDSKQSIDRD
jgi:hypothetical protein